MTSWKELETRLEKGQTIDKMEMALLQAERRRWRDVLTRLVAIIQSLAERNIPMRGSSDRLYQPNNGNFLKEVELMARFDPVLKQHVADVERGARHATYLSKDIQNELIDCIGEKIVHYMLREIKLAKYYSIILDCTPDLSHVEQLSVIVRIVAADDTDTPKIKEHFMGFLEVESSTGESLSNLILKRLEEFNLPFEDCRGQSYDNGANMKGKVKGVQARLLKKNPRALFVPCGAHTLNLVVADAAKSSTDALSYFGYLQRIFTLFSASTQRWAILKHHVQTTVKSWSDTRWESRISSVQAVRFQTAEVRDALLEVREKATDSMVITEAQSLTEEVGSYRFTICSIVWYDMLAKIHHVSKALQSVSMQLDVALNLLRKTVDSLVSYRSTGFASAQVSARDLCEEINVDTVLKQKRLRKTKRQFSYESPDEPEGDALKKLEISFFNVIVDASVTSLQERFKLLGDVQDKFGVLINFPNLTEEELAQECETLSNTLSQGDHKDFDGRELALELNNFQALPKAGMTTMEILNHLKEKKLEEVFPNMWVALRIAVTLPVTVASAERSFSKLKLLKTYLRSTMSQERLNGLALMSVNQEVSSQISFDDTINTFAIRKSRIVKF
ncbi:zinc finger MYM-type protein 1-like [Gadus morhua]|uniref:Zinc finger MYM-type protein 1-like n=1 Tax=Gadus morhua TaxID=8049 RepID=A0A8C5BXS6_GADMO|nr:zinc finger MYM-type protein 1-like [Gadus morhua]